MIDALTPQRSMSSRRQAVLEAIRRHFAARGGSPSHQEIAEVTGLRRQHVGEWLDRLQDEGLLSYRRGVQRSIELVDRSACLSDTEVELACLTRGWRIVKPSAPLADAYALPTDVPDYGLELLEQLRNVG